MRQYWPGIGEGIEGLGEVTVTVDSEGREEDEDDVEMDET